MAGSRRCSLRSRSVFALLLGKELRELFSSRAYWLLLLMIGPLVGHGFITAVETYAEASGIGGGPAALAQGLSPLDGILVPTFGAYDIAVTLLFPFVAIRLVSGERASGAWKLMRQGPAGGGAALSAEGGRLGRRVDSGHGRDGLVAVVRRVAVWAGDVESAARTSAARGAGERGRGGGGGDRVQCSERGDCDARLHGRDVGRRFHRGGTRPRGVHPDCGDPH